MLLKYLEIKVIRLFYFFSITKIIKYVTFNHKKKKICMSIIFLKDLTIVIDKQHKYGYNLKNVSKIINSSQLPIIKKYVIT